MNSSEAAGILEQINELVTTQRFKNYVAQAHSRAILQRLKANPDEWPKYSSDINSYLLDIAHFLLYQGLQLKKSSEYSLTADEAIKQGAEIIEFLYSELSSGDIVRIEHLFTAMLGYYISGHYARAYVLTRQLDNVTSLPEEFQILYHFMSKNFRALRDITVATFNNRDFSDTLIASDLRKDNISQDIALDRILRISLIRAFSYFLEFPKIGDRNFLNRARDILDNAIVITQKQKFVSWWWLLYCARYLLDEYDNNSLWTALSPLKGSDGSVYLVTNYIKANYRRPIPITELWRSQTKALPTIFDETRNSFCLKMPTSAGKTRVAELTILQFLIDNQFEPEAKCLYIAPFRSLAVEVEDALKRSFQPLGFRVSELYGGFELSPIERLLIERTKIIVATPEKIDAFLRYNPELGNQIRLIIIDEGHIVGANERGVRFEVFLHRLIRKFTKQGIRTLFISAVLPNTAQFAEWITDDASNVVEAMWRPSRLMLGELRWNGRFASIHYTHLSDQALEHDCYVSSFISPLQKAELRGTRRRNPFPNDMDEVIADAALRFAQQDMTLVFVAKKSSVAPLCQLLLDAIRVKHLVSSRNNGGFHLPISEDDFELLEECIAVAKETMGEDSIIIEFLKAGFAIHHSSLPQKLRLKIENLLRHQVVKLVVATTTLAQGVNFPFRTVIVHSLLHGHNQPVSPLDFWNICGRAGRGMKENEGQVLFAVHFPENDPHFQIDQSMSDDKIARIRQQRQDAINKHNNEKSRRQIIIQGYRTYKVISGLQSYLKKLIDVWKESYPSIDVAELCIYLANNDFDWVNTDNHDLIKTMLDFLDAQLLALIEESAVETTPDNLQEVMHKSLLILQLEDEPNDELTSKFALDLLDARIQSIHSRFPNKLQRQSFYKLGFAISDCERIDNDKDIILELFLRAVNYYQWNESERCDYLIEVVETIFAHIYELKPESDWHELWKAVLPLWLQGKNPNEISRSEGVQGYTQSPAKLSALIDNLFGYKVPWGLNAISAYLKHIASESNVEIPNVLGYFSSLIKYGVHSPAAASFLAFGLENRNLALMLVSKLSREDISPEELLSWFVSINLNEFLEEMLPENIIELGRAIRKAGRLSGISEEFIAKTFDVLLSTQSKKIEVGETLIFDSNQQSGKSNLFEVFSLWGDNKGLIAITDSNLVNYFSPDKFHLLVQQIESLGDTNQVTIKINEI